MDLWGQSHLEFIMSSGRYRLPHDPSLHTLKSTPSPRPPPVMQTHLNRSAMHASSQASKSILMSHFVHAPSEEEPVETSCGSLQVCFFTDLPVTFSSFRARKIAFKGERLEDGFFLWSAGISEFETNGNKSQCLSCSF